MVKKIIKYPSETLRKPATRVDFLALPGGWSGWSEHIRELTETLNSRPEGLAIASNQLSAEPFRVFVTKPGVINFADEVFVNPSWEPVIEAGQSMMTEGCLSFPEMGWPVLRWEQIRVSYYVPDGSMRNGFTLDGLRAQAFQHECDHLDGKLIIDALGERERIAVRNTMIRRKKSGR